MNNLPRGQRRYRQTGKSLTNNSQPNDILASSFRVTNSAPGRQLAGSDIKFEGFTLFKPKLFENPHNQSNKKPIEEDFINNL
jgi:hypothetical protein